MHPRFSNALRALAALFLLTACDSTLSLKELHHAAPAADPYQAALAAEYQSFADGKLAEYDWWTSKYFADKGLMAAYGRDTQPEDPALWALPATRQGDFAAARARLQKDIEATRTTQPQVAAHALVAYDRWVEAESTAADAAALEEIRDGFFAALNALEEVQAVQSGADAPSTEPAVESTSTILYFPFDSDKLGKGAVAALLKLVEDLKNAGNVSITINGHADRVGTAQYNLSLSERRARVVQKALAAAGVPGNLMHYFAFGDTDPAVPTAAGVKEPKNRRVEIFIE